MAGKRPQVTRRQAVTAGVAIFAVALLVRIWYLYQSSSNPTFATPIVDSATYDTQARSLASGKGLTSGFFWQPVFYQIYLALAYLVSGSSILFAKITQIVLGAVTCFLTFRLATTLFDRRTGITAGLIAAFYGPLIFFEGELLAAGWAAFWSVALLMLFLRARDKKSLPFFAVLGVCGALSVLTRPTFLPFFIAACIWLAVAEYRSRTSRQQLGTRFAALAAGFLIFVLPVSFLNQRATGHFGFLPASGGLNMYIGNNPDPSQTLTVRIGEAWDELQRMPLRHGVTGLYNEQRYFLKQVVDFALSDPVAFTGNLAKKSIQFVDSRETPRNVDLYLYRDWSTLLGMLTWKIGPWGFPFGLLLPFVVAGLIVRRRKLPAPVWLFVVLYPLAVVLVFVSARYRVAVIPVLAVIGAAGFWGVAAHARSWSLPQKAIAAVILACVVVVSIARDPFGQAAGNYEAEMYYGIGCAQQDAGRTREAMASFTRAIELDPAYAEAQLNLGNVLSSIPRWGQAIEHYKKALQIKPEYADAHYDLGIAYLRTGRMEDAIAQFREAIRIRPDYGEAHFNLGLALHLQGDNAGASEHLEEAVKLIPSLSEAHYILGVVLTAQGDFRRAIGEYREALRQNPDWPDALNDLARLLATCEDPAFRNPSAAVKLATRACELTGYKSPGVLETLALAYDADGKTGEARQVALRAVKLARSAGQDDLADRITDRFNLEESGDS